MIPTLKKSQKGEKVSLTLRVPTELKIWAEDFAKRSHLTVSDIFILSLKETQTRGEIRIAPAGYKDEALEDTEITLEKLDFYKKSIAKYEALTPAQKSSIPWEDYKVQALSKI